MNAKEKESVLYTNGYCHNFDVTGYSSVKLHMWSIGDYIVSENESKAVATHAAYEHYLASEKEQSASETPSMMQSLETVFENIADNRDKDAETIAQLRKALEAERAKNEALLWKVEALREGLLLIGSGAEASIRLVEEKPSLGSGQLEGISIIAKEVLEATKTKALQAPKEAGQSEVTLENHDADEFTTQDLEFFARQDNPEKFWYYGELSERQKTMIAKRRQELKES